MISRDAINTHPGCNIPITPDRSCLDKRGMIKTVIKLKLQCFIPVYVKAISEMI